MLFDPEKYDAIYNKIRYLTSQEKGITYVSSQNYVKINVYSCDSLPLEKTLTFYVLILIKSILNKDQNHYYYNTFSEKCSYQIAKMQLQQNFFDSVIMLRFGKTKEAKEEFYGVKKPIKIWDANADDIASQN